MIAQTTTTRKDAAPDTPMRDHPVVGQAQVYSSPITTSPDKPTGLDEVKDVTTTINTENPPSSPTTAKRLACERCHNQKLRCARQHDRLSCDRCLAANATCTERIPRRLGRPHSTNASVSKTTAKKRRQRPVLHQTATPPSSVGQPASSTKGISSSRKSLSGESTTTAADDAVVSNHHHEFITDLSAAVILEPTPPLSLPERRQSPWPLNGLLSPSDCPSPFDWSVSDAENTSAGQQQQQQQQLDDSCHALFPGALIGGLGGGLNSLMPSFEDASDALLVNNNHHHQHHQHHHPHVGGGDPMTVESASPTTSMTQDPVERLTSLHLELYQCLNSFRTIEHQGLVARGEPETDSLAVASALDWVERLFQAAEEFIEILKQGFVGPDAALQYASPASPLMLDEEAEMLHQPSPPPSTSSGLDSATGLMVVSCYVRLLQIFESFASVLPATLDACCAASASLLGVRIGSFCPTVDRKLSTVFIVQYVYHLLDGICGAVEASVGTQGVHGPTLVDARNSEGRVRERISTSVNISCL